MSQRTAVLAGVGVAGIALALAGGALAAAPKGPVVTAGTAAFKLDGEANQFSPAQITINKGGKVTFVWQGFHNVGFLKTGQKVPSLLVPSGGNYTAVNDAAGVPFWWGAAGIAELGFNPQVGAPSKKSVITGAAYVSSGFPTGPKFTWTVTFPKVGTFAYACSVHPGMRGTVRVVASGGQTAAQVAAAAAADAAAKLTKIAKLAKAAKPASATEILAGSGDKHIALLRFYPSKLSVAAGTTVTFTLKGNTEVHSITFGPKAYVDAVEKSFNAPGPFVPGEALLPSDAPGVPVAITGLNHGNGFVSSGVLSDPGAGPAPHSFQVRFTTPGTYAFRCIIHSESMHGTITVT